jgi:hypothetical protein
MKLSFYIQWEMIYKIRGVPEINKNQNRGKSAVRASWIARWLNEVTTSPRKNPRLDKECNVLREYYIPNQVLCIML